MILTIQQNPLYVHMQPGFFSEIIPVVAQTMGGAFPEIIEKQKEIILIVREEESSFSNLLEKGVKYLSELISSGGIVNGEISGEQAFFLYDSLGFPLDLTQIMAAENGLRVDTQGFQDAMNIQKTRSRLATVNLSCNIKYGTGTTSSNCNSHLF